MGKAHTSRPKAASSLLISVLLLNVSEVDFGMASAIPAGEKGLTGKMALAYNQSTMSLTSLSKQESWRALWEYRQMLARCSDEELQDVYFHIDVLQYPERYRVVLDELARRGLRPVSGIEPQMAPLHIPDQVRALPVLKSHPVLAGMVASLLLTLYTAGVTFLFCLPIYLLALPLKVLNQQSAFFYLLFFPFAPLSAAGFGRRAGGTGWYTVSVLIGVGVGVLLFVGTGALHAVVQALFHSGGGGGFSLPVAY
mgnify:CR=1 FL=1